MSVKTNDKIKLGVAMTLTGVLVDYVSMSTWFFAALVLVATGLCVAMFDFIPEYENSGEEEDLYAAGGFILLLVALPVGFFTSVIFGGLLALAGLAIIGWRTYNLLRQFMRWVRHP